MVQNINGKNLVETVNEQEPNSDGNVKVTDASAFIKVADNFADDAAAATGGIEIGQLYHTNGVVHIRIV